MHFPSAVVGPPDPRLVLRRVRPYQRLPGRSHQVRKVRLHAPDPRPGRAGHLVLLRSVALLHFGLAGKDRGPGVFLSHFRHGHRLRYHLLLGGPDDFLRLRADEEDPVPHRAHPWPGAGRQGPQDVQVSGQRHRPAGDGREVRRRRPALQPHHRQQPRKRHPFLHGEVRGHAQLRQQDLERQPVRHDEPDHRQVHPARDRRACR